MPQSITQAIRLNRETRKNCLCPSYPLLKFCCHDDGGDGDGDNGDDRGDDVDGGGVGGDGDKHDFLSSSRSAYLAHFLL